MRTRGGGGGGGIPPFPVTGSNSNDFSHRSQVEVGGGEAGVFKTLVLGRVGKALHWFPPSAVQVPDPTKMPFRFKRSCLCGALVAYGPPAIVTVPSSDRTPNTAEIRIETIQRWAPLSRSLTS
jgi:hypothetical protein